MKSGLVAAIFFFFSLNFSDAHADVGNSVGQSSVGLSGVGGLIFAQENDGKSISVGADANFFVGNYVGAYDTFFRGTGLLKVSPVRHVDIGLRILYGLNQNELQDPARIKLGVDVAPAIRTGWNVRNFSVGLGADVRLRSGVEQAGINPRGTGASAKLLFDYRLNQRLSFHVNAGFSLDNGRNLSDVLIGPAFFDVYRLSTDINDANKFGDAVVGIRYQFAPWITAFTVGNVQIPMDAQHINFPTYRISPILRVQPFSGLALDVGVVFGFGGGGGIVIPPMWMGNAMLSYSFWPSSPPPKIQIVEVEKRVFVSLPPPPIDVCRDNDKLRIPLITFNPNTIDLLPGSADVVARVAEILKSHPEIEEIEIGVHTDEDGDDEANANISRERALKVKDLLVSSGIAQDRLSIMGFGKAKPLVVNRVEVGRAQNRRIEFKIVRTKSSNITK